MDAMEKILKSNRKRIHEIAERNTLRNADGTIVFTKKDPWVQDTAWDKAYEEIPDGANIKREDSPFWRASSCFV